MSADSSWMLAWTVGDLQEAGETMAESEDRSHPRQLLDVLASEVLRG